MKKIFSLGLLLFIASFSYAQIEKVEDAKQLYNSNFRKLPLYTYYYKDINNHYTPFIGKWIYQNGNQTFVIRLWKETKVDYTAEAPRYYTDELRGHYKLVQNYGQPNEQIIYTSEINIGTSPTPWSTVLTSARVIDNYRMSGSIYDVIGQVNPAYPTGVRGQLEMKINSTNPNTAQWKVTLPQGMRGMDQPSTFTIPTNVTLTKVN